jgi:hypothetical protein
MQFCASSNYGNHILGSVNLKKQKRIMDVDQLQVLEAALLLVIVYVCVCAYVCVRVQIKSQRKAISLSKLKP